MKKIIIIVMLILLTSGCSDYRELSDMAMISNIAIDKEDDKYYYIVHDELKFNNAEANVELEIEFEFDLRDIERTARICNVKPSYFGSIRLSLSEAESDNDWEEIHPYEDDGEY